MSETNSKIAAQLFFFRNEMSASPVKTLKKIKEIGFTKVEAAGLYGCKAEYLRGICDALGIEIVSDHISMSALRYQTEDMIHDLKALGCRYVAVPWLGREDLPGGEKFSETVKFFAEIGERLANEGITFMFHNHSNEFIRVNGDYALDVLYNSVSPKLLKAEIDVGWATYMDVDAAKLVGRYKGRLPIVHVKDFSGDNSVNENGTRAPLVDCPAGCGNVPLAEVVKESLTAGAELFVTDQDNPSDGLNVFECAAKSYENIYRAIQNAL